MHALSLLISSLAATTAPAVSVESLLPQMTDMTHLTTRPSPYYTTAQASSYDRNSNPGPNADPFANGDAGKFLRVEKTPHGNEYVMADLKGPGAAVRVWSANPAGTVRFYFDGEATPRLQAKLADLLTGKVAPFIEPFAYGAAQGTNLYFPFPYAKGLKVTVDESDGDKVKSLYYHVGYRQYDAGTRVATFDPADLSRLSLLLMQTRMRLQQPELSRPRELVPRRLERTVLSPNQELELKLSGGGTMRELEVRIPFPLVVNIREMDWEDPFQPHNVLRQILFHVEVDGKPVISTPLGDFFGTAGGLAPNKTMPFEVRTDGTLICRLPMPYHRSLVMRFQNIGKVDVPLGATVLADPRKPAPGAYALHAEYKVDKGRSRPMRDMSFLNATGEGVWVGSNLHVSNPTPAWWGEGDEKVYVDGEPFPSTFGTGTEDYYGYAWCSPLLFDRPYHSQPLCNGPGNFGHTNVNRWHVLDPIPYRESLKFDMEMWHWADVDVVFAHTAFWYAPAGSHRLAEIDRATLLPIRLKPADPVKGALEGEKMRVVSKTGGTTQNQGGFWELSAGEQLWWIDVEPKDRLELAFSVAKAGRYEVVGNFCHARDYGIHRLTVGGKDAGQHDFYAPGVTWKKISLGTFDLPAGEVRLTAECVGKNDAALPARMLGLDYVLLTEARNVGTGRRHFLKPK